LGGGGYYLLRDFRQWIQMSNTPVAVRDGVVFWSSLLLWICSIQLNSIQFLLRDGTNFNHDERSSRLVLRFSGNRPRTSGSNGRWPAKTRNAFVWAGRWSSTHRQSESRILSSSVSVTASSKRIFAIDTRLG